MELNKTKCVDCGHLNRWSSYKWASTPERREHNRKNNKECPRCGSTNVKNHEDDETMGPYRAVAALLPKPLLQNPPVTEESYLYDPVVGPAIDAHATRPIDKLLNAKSLEEVGDHLGDLRKLVHLYGEQDGDLGSAYTACGMLLVGVHHRKQTRTGVEATHDRGKANCPACRKLDPSTMTKAPYGPDVTLSSNGDGSGEVLFHGGTYAFASHADLLARAESLPFTVEIVMLYPGQPGEQPQIKIGDAEKDAGFWRCECGSLNNHGIFSSPYYCFSCGRAEPADDHTTFVPIEAGSTDALGDFDAAYLRDLAGRLMDVPVKYGVGQADVDRLTDIADNMEG